MPQSSIGYNGMPLVCTRNCPFPSTIFTPI